MRLAGPMTVISSASFSQTEEEKEEDILMALMIVVIRCPQPQSGMRHLVNAYEVEAGTV